MADNAEYISLMNTSLPANRDPRADGAAEIRAVKTAVKNCFPNVDAPVTATAAQMNNIFNQGMSVGMIVMWSGTEENVPKGWALCDGKIANNEPTPDLRGRFVMGWNPARSGVDADDIVGIKEESDTTHYDLDLSKYLTSEPHTLTVGQIPEHSHKFEWGNNYDTVKAELSVVGNNKASEGEAISPRDDGGNKIRLQKTGAGESHRHGLVAAADGKNKFDKRPAWYALAFIMYVGTGKL